MCACATALFAKGGGQAPAPAAAPTPGAMPAAVAKPEVALPLSPRSAAAAKPVDDAISSAEAAAAAALEALDPAVRVHALPARLPGETEAGPKGVPEERRDYDWKNLRAVEGRFWLVGEKVVLVSAAADPASWPVQHRERDSDLDFADVFSTNGSSYLLGSGWIAEIAADGSEMLRMVHLVPSERIMINMMNFFATDGPGKKADLPAEFTRADVWRDQVWIRNTSDWAWKFGKYLSSIGREGRTVRAGHEDVLFAFARNREGAMTVAVSSDGRTWKSTPVQSIPDEDGVAAGRGRLVKVYGPAFATSTDGVEWKPTGIFLPERNIVRKDREGNPMPRTERGSWRTISFADGIFVAAGSDFRDGATYEAGGQPDDPVVAYSADGIRWKVVHVPLKSPPDARWLIAGVGGRFVVTPKTRSSELAEILFTVSGSGPAEAVKTAEETRRAIEQALECGDAKTAIAQLARLGVDHPGLETMRVEATVRAKSGDLDGAWSILGKLEGVEPGNVLDAGTRAMILQAAGRAAEARAYAMWFLSQTPWGDLSHKGTTQENIQRFTLLVGAGRSDDAIRFGEAEARRDTRNAEWRLMLGMAHLQKGDIATGRRWINDAAQLGDPRAKQILTRLPPQ